MNSLKQRLFLITKKFNIEDKGLKISSRYLINQYETIIPFEELSNKVGISTENKYGWLVASSISLVIAVGLFIGRLMGSKIEIWADLVWFGIGMFCFAIFYVNYAKYRLIITENGQNIVFFENKPNKKTLDNFIEEVFLRRKSYFIEKYLNTRLNLSDEERLDAVKWLYNKEVINVDEYNKYSAKKS